MSVNNPSEVTFKLKAIDIIQSRLEGGGKPLGEETRFDFDITIEQNISSETSLFQVICKVEISTEQKKKKEGYIETSCMFEILNLKEFTLVEGKGMEVPGQLLITLNSIALSTTRGVMFATFKGTRLHHAILPVVNPGGFRRI